MPRKDTPRFGTAYGWLRGEDWWGDPTSDNRVLYDALLHPYVLSTTSVTPPSGAENGDQYIVAVGGQGPWLGHDNSLATLVEGTWRFVRPVRGVRVRVHDINIFIWWDGESWVPEDVSGVPDPDLGTRYDIAMSVGYGPEPNETLLFLPIVQAMYLGAGAPGSHASVLTPPTAGVQLTISRNGSQIGTVTYTSSDFNGIISVPADVPFAPGDRLRINCPLTLPPDFENFGMVLRMTLI